MLVARGTKLFGADAVMLHQASQWLKEETGGFSIERELRIEALQFATAIGMPVPECAPVLDALVKAKWLGRSGSQYVVKQPFVQLAMARIGAPLPRAKADALLGRIVKDAEAINADADSDCAFVLEIAVFGSYLDKAKLELGDLDVGVRLQPRPKRADWKYTGLADLPTRGGEALARKRLQGRSPYVSLHGMDEVVERGFAHRVVYTRRAQT